MPPDSSAQSPYSVLVGVDYSKESARALAEAVELARHHAGSRIHALHVVPSVPLPVPAPGVPDLIATGPEP